MATGKEALIMVTLAAAACRPAPAFDLPLPQAQPVAYETIRDASGVLGYAESLLGPEIAVRYQAVPGPGASNVDPESVAGAWELPLGTRPAQVADALRARGVLSRPEEFRDGSLWIGDFQATNGPRVRLLLIDGANAAFETQAVPEVRPGPHVYLIAYRI